MSFFGIDPAKILVLNDLLVFDMGQSVQNIGTKGLTRKILWNKDLASEFGLCTLNPSCTISSNAAQKPHRVAP